MKLLKTKKGEYPTKLYLCKDRYYISSEDGRFDKLYTPYKTLAYKYFNNVGKNLKEKHYMLFKRWK